MDMPDAVDVSETEAEAVVAPQTGRGIDPHVFVIFGATGDLTRRKLLPALYRLLQEEEVAERCYVLGTARSEWSDEEFRQVARGALAEHGFSEEELTNWCHWNIFYQSLGEDGQDFRALRQRIRALEDIHELPGNRAFYLSLPPGLYGPVTEAIGEAGLTVSPGWTRLVIEKPFGFDLRSAQKLNDLVHEHFDEEQIYRIDHYLAKETVQNLLAFRFGNAIFETLWTRDRIDRMEITVAEKLGVGTRAGYYDESGALRDMVQNHLTQLLTLVAMEPPASFEADAIRQEKVKVLKSARPLGEDDVVLGQYSRGSLNGQNVPGYTETKGVDEQSDTETFAALRVHIANWRWQGVPFYLRTGKRLPVKRTRIAIHFTEAPVFLFESDGEDCGLSPNVLVITLQPNEGFDLQFEVKAPGEPFQLQTRRLSFSYEEAFGPVPDAYETLLRDIITGDQTLFVRADEVEASWRLYTPLLEAGLPVHAYEAGTWGPEAADSILTEWTNGVERS